MKSFKLLFKNGFKQLFQFKFSLLAILILALMGSLVISTSVTTIKKLDTEFETVVNSQEKFSNVYENSTLEGLGDDFGYVPFLDLVSKEESTSAFINPNGEEQSNLNLNLVDENSFYGKFFKGEEFKNLFPFLLTQYATDRRGNYLTMVPHTTISKYLDSPEWKGDAKFSEEYGAYIEFWIEQYKQDGFKLNFDKVSTWYSYATDILFNYYIDELSTYKNDELEKTIIGKYTKTSPKWFDKFRGETFNEVLDKNKDSNDKDFEMYKYVHFSLSTLISQVMYMGDEFLSLVRTDWQNFAPYIYTPAYAFKYIFGTQPYNSEKFNDVNSDDNKKNILLPGSETHGTVEWEGLSNFDKDQYDFLNFNGNEDLKEFNDSNDISIVGEFNTTSELKTDDFKNLVLENGYRGMLNPLVQVNKIEGETTTTTIVAKNDFNSLKGITDGVYKNSLQKDVTQSQLLSAFYQSEENTKEAASMYGIDFADLYNRIKNTWPDEQGLIPEFHPIQHWSLPVNVNVYKNPINTYYKQHLKLAAKFADDMKITIRDELIYSDILAGKKYRLITMDSLENTNFELIEGLKPKNLGEVAISSQYAKYNNVKVGDLLKIGKTNLAVSGIAVDAYSFYPIVDPLMPVPKPKTSGIMYIQKQALEGIFKNDTTQMDMSSYKQSVYLFANSNKQTNDFLYWSNLSQSNYYQNHVSYFSNKSIDQIPPMSLISFDDSSEALNWTVFEMFIKVFIFAISGIVAIIMLAISIMLFLVIKKSIQMNIEKIAILISIGYKPFEISVNYIWYSIVITIASVPLGWIIGTFLQLPIERLLQDFFTIDAKVIMFSPEALFISFALISVVIGLVLTMLIAWRKMSKPYIELMNENNIPNKNYLFSFIKTKIIRNSGFKRRLAFDVASGSSKSLLLMSALLTISALMISNLIFIPYVALTTQTKYNENIKYKNQFKFNDPISNDPLSARNLNYWEGVEDNIDNMLETNYTIGKSDDKTIINNYGGYKSISSNSTFMPQLLYSPAIDASGNKNGEYIRTAYEDMVNDPSEILSIILGSFMYNLHNSNGKSLSIGMFDQFTTEFMNVENGLSLEAKSKSADRMSRIIGGSLPTILKMVNFPNMDFSGGEDWKEALLRSFTTKAPSYIKEYIGVKERQDSINFGYNTVNVVPGKDSLGTALTLATSDGNLDVVGVDSNQTAFEIPNKSYKQIYGSDKQINDIYRYLNGETDDIDSDNQYFDKQTNTLTIPMIINQEQKIVNKINVGKEIDDINVNSNKYVLNTENDTNLVIPNAAWKYDDTDFVRSDYFANNFKGKEYLFDYSTEMNRDGKNHYYKDAFNIDPNKVSYKNQYTHVVSGNQDDYYKSLDQDARDFSGEDFTNTDNAYSDDVELKYNTYMFGDFAYGFNDQTGITEIKASYTRPYYNYRNFKMFIPVSSITSAKKDTDEEGYYKALNKFVFNNGVNSFSTESERLMNSGWTTSDGVVGKAHNVRTITKERVPTDTIKAYQALGKNDLDEWIAIKPYDIDPLTQYRGAEQYLTGVSWDGSSQYWLKNMLTRTDGDVTGISIKSTPINTSVKPDLKVKLKVVDIMDTYNGIGMITNSDLLNLLVSVENNKQTVFDSSRLDKYGYVRSEEGIKLYKTKEFKPLNENDWEKDAYIMGDKNDVNHSLVSKYNNSIYSNMLEPLQITTGVSMQTKNSSSTFSMHDDLNAYGIAIEETKLLAEEKEVIDQLFKVAMFIALIFITIILIIVIIVILISSDIYLSRLRTFIVSLKAFGYKKREIWGLVFGVSMGLVVLSTIFGFLLSWGTVSAIIAVIIQLGMAVPFVVSPWVPIITFFLIVPLWVIGSLIISNQILLLKPVEGFRKK